TGSRSTRPRSSSGGCAPSAASGRPTRTDKNHRRARRPCSPESVKNKEADMTVEHDANADGDPRTPHTTTDAGIPVASDSHSLQAGQQGPVLLHDHYLIEKMAHFNRERVPERVVHAKGSGAFGELVITGDVSEYTKADFLQPGRRTEVLFRFSTV